MTHNERQELQHILIKYIEHPRKMGSCILAIEELIRRVHSRWNGFRYEHRDVSLVDQILNEVAQTHNVEVTQIQGNRRSKYLVRAREEIAERMYKAGFTYAEISRALNRHASTVIYTLAKVKNND